MIKEGQHTQSMNTMAGFGFAWQFSVILIFNFVFNQI